MGNEIDLLLILSSGTCATFIHVRTSNNYFEKINSRTKGIQGNLKMGDR